MPYLQSASEITTAISLLKTANTLWMDTETADFNTKKPQLSLISISTDPDDMSGENIYILDMLNNEDLLDFFITEIMVNSQIEKVFHNASYDLKFLGGKKAKNITCTLEMAKKIPYYYLPVANYQLQTLTAELCNYQNIDKSAQTSDWRIRPLAVEQIDYAYFDCIYLAQVHQKLIELEKEVNPVPEQENLIDLTTRYQEIIEQYKLLDSEVNHLEERIKKAMQAQAIEETNKFKLTTYERTTSKVKLRDLIQLVNSENLELDFPITLTQKLKADIGVALEKIEIETETNTSVRLNVKNQSVEE